MKQLILAVAILFIPILVLAVNGTNSTVNETINETIVNISFNETNMTINETIDVNVTVVNETNSSEDDEIVQEEQLQPLLKTIRYPREDAIAISNVAVVETCKDVTWQTTEVVMDVCERDVVCDPENTSCTGVEEYACKINDRVVTHVKEKCVQEGLVLDNTYSLDTKEYKCSVTQEGSSVVAICDSKRDGDGNGKCKSGETCMKYVLRNGNLETYQKNSQDVFVESDESFFLEAPQLEVLR